MQLEPLRRPHVHQNLSPLTICPTNQPTNLMHQPCLAPSKTPHVTRGRLNAQQLAPYNVGLMAKGDVFTEETSDMWEAVVEGFTQEDMLHGVLYS